MENLIKALQIFYKYVGNVSYPTHCSHDKLIMCIDLDKNVVSRDDMLELECCGFFWDEYNDCFVSYRYGSC